MYGIIIVVVALIILVICALRAPNFEESTGYDPRCFNCNETNCVGCVVTGPCYGCQKECSVDCPFDPVLGKYHAKDGHYIDAAGNIIGTYTKGE